MTVRTKLIAVVDQVYKRVLAPPSAGGALDLTPYQLAIISRQWSGARIGEGNGVDPDFTDTTLRTLPQYSEIRQLSMKEISGSGGRYRDGAVVVEDVSPQGDGGIGYTPGELAPVGDERTEIIHKLIGPTGGLGGEYTLAEGRFDDWQTYALVLNVRRTSP